MCARQTLCLRLSSSSYGCHVFPARLAATSRPVRWPDGRLTGTFENCHSCGPQTCPYFSAAAAARNSGKPILHATLASLLWPALVDRTPLARVRYAILRNLNFSMDKPDLSLLSDNDRLFFSSTSN